jgi:DNA uptake protein ComE-like DNA-binding protein
MLASMLVAGLLFRVRGELAAASAGVGSEDAYAAAVGGVRRVSELLSDSLDAPAEWTNSPTLFRDRYLGTFGGIRWLYTVYAANPDDPGNLRYGVIDESSRINVNTASAEVLASLPGMSNDLVDALIDYRDRDDTPRPEGAEEDYYLALRYPYRIRNGPLARLEELLLIRGFDARLVYGEDANRNGRLDAGENDGDQTFPPDDGDGRLAPGLAEMLTTVSADPGLDANRLPKLHIKDDLEAVRQLDLAAETLDFIDLYQAEGNVFNDVSELLEAEYTLKQSHGADPGHAAGAVIRSGVGADDLALIMDGLTVRKVSPDKPLPGRVNVNTASLEVLTALDGIDEALARQIADRRTAVAVDESTTTAWLYRQGLVDAETFRRIAPQLTARSYQYRVRIVSYPEGRTGPYCVLEVVIDLSGNRLRILRLRDLTRFGFPTPQTGVEAG